MKTVGPEPGVHMPLESELYAEVDCSTWTALEPADIMTKLENATVSTAAPLAYAGPN
jgi:hypothetical protein